MLLPQVPDSEPKTGSRRYNYLAYAFHPYPKAPLTLFQPPSQPPLLINTMLRGADSATTKLPRRPNTVSNRLPSGRAIFRRTWAVHATAGQSNCASGSNDRSCAGAAEYRLCFGEGFCNSKFSYTAGHSFQRQGQQWILTTFPNVHCLHGDVAHVLWITASSVRSPAASGRSGFRYIVR